MKILGKLILSLFIPLMSMAQEATTLEEYRYLTKGYAYQKEMGLDATKEGYDIRSLFSHENGVRFVGLYKQYATSPQAILAILMDTNKKERYICLPNNQASEDLMKQYEQDKNNELLGYQLKQQYEEALRALLFTMTGGQTLAHTPVQSQAPIPQSYEQKIEMTSKGIPINTDRASNRPPQNQKPTETMAPSTASTIKVVDTGETAVNTKAQATVKGDIQGRPLLQPVVVLEKHHKRGKVVIKVCVNQEGEIISAKFTQRGSTTLNAELKQIALNSAEAARFAKSEKEEQCGYIAYHFQ